MRQFAMVAVFVVVTALCSSCTSKGNEVSVEPRGEGSPDQPTLETKYVEVSFRTTDGLTIRGDFLDAKTDKGIVLLHQWNADARTWRPYLANFADKGVSALAIDARGYGRSERQGNQRFAPEWNIGYDIAGAIEFLKSKGCKRVVIAGSSYGANNALIYAATHPEIPAVILLSPGEDYHGLKIADAARTYQGRVMVITAEGDRGTGRATEILRDALKERLSLVLLKGTGHGTDLLDARPELATKIAEFARDILTATPARP